MEAFYMSWLREVAMSFLKVLELNNGDVEFPGLGGIRRVPPDYSALTKTVVGHRRFCSRFANQFSALGLTLPISLPSFTNYGRFRKL